MNIEPTGEILGATVTGLDLSVMADRIFDPAFVQNALAPAS